MRSERHFGWDFFSTLFQYRNIRETDQTNPAIQCQFIDGQFLPKSDEIWLESKIIAAKVAAGQAHPMLVESMICLVICPKGEPARVHGSDVTSLVLISTIRHWLQQIGA